MLIKPQAGKGLGRFTAQLLNLEMECSIRPSFLVLWCAFVMWLLIVVMDASIRLSLLSDIMCTVYQVSACSSSPGSDKSTAQSSSVEGWGTLSNFIVVVKYYFLFFNQVQYVLGSLHPAGVSCQLCMDLKIYILFFPLAIYFADISLLCVREPHGSCMHRTMLPVAMGTHIKVII